MGGALYICELCSDVPEDRRSDLRNVPPMKVYGYLPGYNTHKPFDFDIGTDCFSSKPQMLSIGDGGRVEACLLLGFYKYILR